MAERLLPPPSRLLSPDKKSVPDASRIGQARIQKNVGIVEPE